MITILSTLVSLLSFRVRSRASLELELIALRHQVIVLRRGRPRRLRLFLTDRLVVIAPRSPWQNPFVERVVGSVRRECLDHVIVLNERHLRHVLSSYFQYYNDASYYPTFLCA
jgi:hypothetical protein